MRKAYSYIRFSSAEQSKGRSQERQREDCEKYCEQHGLHLARDEEYTFLDRGRSAYKAEHLGEHGQLARFLRLVKDGTIERGSYLIVESLDRLSREHIKHALPRFIDLLNDGINIVTLADSKMYTSEFTEMDLIMSIFVMSRAYNESSTKSIRVRDAIRAKHRKARELGLPMGAAIPLWLKLSKDKQSFVVIEDRAAVVRRVFEMAIAGYGRTATAKALNADGVPSFKGKSWGTSSIDKVLNNKAVIGEYQPYSVQASIDGKRQPAGDAIKGYYPVIVDEKTYYQAQAAIDARKVAGTTKQSQNINLWSGIAKCSECGTAMHLVNKGRSPKGGTYLQCFKARKGLCSGKLVRLDNAEAVFPHMLKRMDALSLVQDHSGKLKQDLREVEGRLVEQQAYLTKTQAVFEQEPNAFVSRVITSTMEKISQLEHDKERLQGELEAEKISNWKNFIRRVDLVSPAGRLRANALLKRLKVVVYIGRRGVSEEGYYVTEKGAGIFVLAYKDGEVKCLMFDKAEPDFDRALVVPAFGQLFGMMERNQAFPRTEIL